MDWSVSGHHAIIIDPNLPADPSFKEVTLKSTDKPGIVQRCFPTGFKHEMKELIKFSLPIVLTIGSILVMEVSGPMFVGHLGKYIYGAASLAISIGNVVGTSIGIGLIAACDTLFSQCYGSVNKLQVGIYLQTAIYVSSLAVIVSWGLLMNTNNILLLLGQDAVIAKYTEEFLFIFLPSIFFLFLYQLFNRYLQVQGKVMPSMVVGVISNCINALLQYLLIYVADMGLVGSATALLIGYTFMMSLLLAYMYFSKAYIGTWGGWTRESLKDWGQYMKLGLSSLVMLCMEWWAFEAAMFLVGILGPVQLGANSVLSQTWNIYSMLSLGTGSACAYRVGRYLGSNNIPGAVTTARVSLILSSIIALMLTIITFALWNQLPFLFTSDTEVIELSTELIPLLALTSFLCSAKNIGAGIVRGTGKQMIGGIIAFVAFVIFALPIGISLLFLTELETAGFWWGYNIGFFIEAVAFMIIVFTMNWEKEAADAQLRAKVQLIKMTESTDLLSNRSQYKEKSVTYKTIRNNDVCHTESYWRKLVIKRLFIVGACVGIFVIGLVFRFVILPPPALNFTLGNNQTQLRLTSII